MLEFFVTKGQELKRRDHDVVSADTTDLKASFTLTEDFTGTITVWWRRSDKPGSTWTSTLSGNQCTIPAEALSAATDNVMYGEYDHFVFVSISDTGRTTSAECEIKVNKSAFSTNATPGTGGSPTAYEELVEQFDELKADNQTFKDNMTEQQETFESTVTENVDNIRYVVETETAPPIIEEASGAEITLDDSAHRQVRGLNLYGYSKQVTTTGAQLYDANGNANSVSGVTLYIDDDGYVILNGTATNDVFFNSSVESPFAGNVYVSMNNITVNGNIIFRFLNESGAIINSFSLDAVSKTASYNFTESVHTMTIRVANGTTLNDFRLRPMINSGTTPLPWEPYSGGVASPSPDWAQPIHSVADGGSVIVRSTGANLMDITKLTRSKTQGVVTQQILDDGASVISGTGSTTQRFSNARSLTDDEKKYFVSDDYTISGAKPGYPYAYFRIDKSDGSHNEINLDDRNTETKEYSISDDDSVIFGFYANTGMTISAQTSYPMLNRGSTALPWQPYVAPSSALITLTDSLRGIPVTSGGTYTDESGQQWIADYIYRRQTDGKWCLWRNCGLATNLSFSLASFGNQESSHLYQSTPISSNSDDYTNGLCDYLVQNNGLSGANLSGFYIYEGTIRARFKDSFDDASNIEKLKSYSFVYQRYNPTVEELPDDVQAELNGLYTYNLHTDMWNSDGAYMNLKYVADTKTWINNKIAGLSTAMLNQN